MLLDHGHPDAWQYPLPMVFAEAKLVSRRLDVQTASHMSLLQLALFSQPSENVKPAATKKMGQKFADLLKGLFHGE